MKKIVLFLATYLLFFDIFVPPLLAAEQDSAFTKIGKFCHNFFQHAQKQDWEQNWQYIAARWYDARWRSVWQKASAPHLEALLQKEGLTAEKFGCDLEQFQEKNIPLNQLAAEIYAILPQEEPQQLARNFRNNFHSVEAGKCYRSKHLALEELADYIKRYSIKTVLCLQGSCLDEEKIVRASGADYVGIPLKSNQLPSKEDIASILHVFEKCRKPLLIQCRFGAGRTSMISALYVLEQMHRSKAQAKQEFSFWYGYTKETYAVMEQFIDLYEGRHWLHFHYPSFFEHQLAACKKEHH